MKRSWAVFLALLLGCSSSHRYELAICALFKNEAPWLQEWIVYHHTALGIGHFYLYNNESSDDYAAVLQPFIEKGIVELIDWDCADPSHLAYGPFMDAPWSAAQLGAYNDCLKKRAFGVAKWVAMIDIDEFIVPVQGKSSLYSALRRAERKGKGTVSLHWRVFGTSNIEDLSPGDLLTEKLVYRSSDGHAWNQLVKSIHRPEAVGFCLVHIAEKLLPGFGASTLPPEKLRIHHYWTRTQKFCREKRNLANETDPQFFESLHQVKDTAILQYVEKLKETNWRTTVRQ